MFLFAGRSRRQYHNHAPPTSDIHELMLWCLLVTPPKIDAGYSAPYGSFFPQGGSEMKALRRLAHDCCGATGAEYALILAILGAAVSGGAYLLASSEAEAVTTTAALIKP
jgi:Flp pilus assembly pilin Flp